MVGAPVVRTPIGWVTAYIFCGWARGKREAVHVTAGAFWAYAHGSPERKRMAYVSRKAGKQTHCLAAGAYCGTPVLLRNCNGARSFFVIATCRRVGTFSAERQRLPAARPKPGANANGDRGVGTGIARLLGEEGRATRYQPAPQSAAAAERTASKCPRHT